MISPAAMLVDQSKRRVNGRAVWEQAWGQNYAPAVSAWPKFGNFFETAPVEAEPEPGVPLEKKSAASDAALCRTRSE
ncbi:hypothetical protein [Methyloferula stellata]|uniref:hypothetical protein n=1 Tax=Methyloferula stellata TaxID=876270 RepID=UPI0003A84CB3|nr:hypothetical protein [Methyloferula stellata]